MFCVTTPTAVSNDFLPSRNNLKHSMTKRTNRKQQQKTITTNREKKKGKLVQKLFPTNVLEFLFSLQQTDDDMTMNDDDDYKDDKRPTTLECASQSQLKSLNLAHQSQVKCIAIRFFFFFVFCLFFCFVFFYVFMSK